VPFHPLVADWFARRFGTPTPLQAQAWPVIAGGGHALLVAPTGSGKTLAAFLFAIDRLVTGAWPPGRTSVLYVSPLKALNNDVQRNLLGPLEELGLAFAAAGAPFPAIRALTRSGDTPPEERRRLLRHPPEVLITTPESLNLLLASPAGRDALGHLRTVILDEIHAVAGSRRGTHLVTAVERLVPLAGEFQRIALSATVRPLDTVAAFVGGLRLDGPAHAPRHVPRPVAVVHAGEAKRYALAVRFPAAAVAERELFWAPYVAELRAIIARNRSTLVFVNSRRLCEKIAHLVNEGEARPVAWAHHGSLARELRAEVERRLKAGELRAIVATSSLELGIDIGALDEVVLLQSPPSVSAAVQRIGRAGHAVGETSRGTFLPTHPLDLAEAAVLAAAVPEHAIEEIRPVEAPLDVLAQVLVALALERPTQAVDDLYRQVRASWPYRDLPRGQFDLVLEMLAGRYAETRLRELSPRLLLDRLEGTVTAAKGARMLLAVAGGTIPDRGSFHLRHHETSARIGDLDEEFVWEAKVGQTFTFGAQNWRIERITHNDVFARPADPRAIAPPFWRAEEYLRDAHLAARLGCFLEEADGRLDDPAYPGLLETRNALEPDAARRLVAFLAEQKRATRGALPHRHHLLVESAASGPGGYPGRQVILHTLWGGRVNRPFAIALEAAWERRFGHLPELYAGNETVTLVLPHEVGPAEILELVRRDTALGLVRARLEASGFFGARFRECAGRALLLPRRHPGERQPLWLTRLRSQRLLESVRRHEDFPVLLETWRTCLRDELDVDTLLARLGELETGAIAWTHARTAAPSPFARAVSWQQLNDYVYRDDTPASAPASRLREDLVREVAGTPGLRPAVPPELVRRFEEKRRRLAPGYAPETPRELLEWVKERVLVPTPEWGELLHAMGEAAAGALAALPGKLVLLAPPGADSPLVAARESLPRIRAGFYPGAALAAEPVGGGAPLPAPSRPPAADEEALTALLGEWLRFFGPRPAAWVESSLGIAPARFRAALEDLLDEGAVIAGDLVAGEAEPLVCDRENFEILLRLRRSSARPSLEPLPLAALPLLLAHRQGLAVPARDPEALFGSLERLACLPAAADAWEQEILPARAAGYEPAWLDHVLQQSDLLWVGAGARRVAFCFDEERDLPGAGAAGEEAAALFPDPDARYDFATLLRLTGLRSADLAERLWRGVWSGRVANDSFAALRRGLETGFAVPEAAGLLAHRSGRRGAFNRWKSAVPWLGAWRLLPPPEAAGDPLEADERGRERVRILLARYGVLFRELVAREPPPFRWAGIFRSLRLMELAGEVVAGYFFHGVPGPQFAAPELLGLLAGGLPEDAAWWLAATDPASPCGLGLAGLPASLPRRVSGAWLSFRGREPLLVARRNGRDLTIAAAPDDPGLAGCLAPLRHLLTRDFRPLPQLVVERVNGERAARSPYAGPLREAFDAQSDVGRLILQAPRSARPRGTV
jgi:ATP-dependent Lhr-like helicase